ncbi:MAG: HypC/HybG/HupF family hydrogenase formation chaperone [Candidatus Parcubacteria bacterium]|nr:HypC/HybG/HupF family hydrogenase formation chaperone [Candidatus Parcubacteria bacterium]
MCLTIPGKIKRISGKTAVIEQNNKLRKISLAILDKLKIGDWILVLNNMAVEKISSLEAKKIINLYKYEQSK